LPALAARQRTMLERAARAVKPGGRVVFATCSSEPEEGEDVVAEFLGGHSAFAVEDPRSRPGPLAALPGLFTADGFLRTWPHAHALESFFAAVLRRRR
jgi:16S rRNA (cytosine967-C5)-methyltransferase